MASKEMITIPKSEYLEMKQQVELLSHQLAELRRMVFGAKKERFIPTDPSQYRLFDLPQEQAEKKQQEEITYTRSKPAKDKKQPLRAELAPHLPRREEVIEPEGLPEGAKKIGQAVTEVLEYEPATIYVRRIVRPKYVVASSDEQTQITVADLPALPIPKGNAGAGILAYLLISKFVDHLPFYRLVQILKRQDVIVAESTINGWFNAACSNRCMKY
nr:transposase [Sunxiuqinia dokdonensis]